MSDNQQPSFETDRTCRKCGLTKPLPEFLRVYAPSARGRQYRSHTCLVCFRVAHAAKERKRRAANPERYRQSHRAWYDGHREQAADAKKRSHRKLKDQVFGAYGGYLCTCCGETEPSMLTIDHINGDGAAHRKRVSRTKHYGSMTSVTVYHLLRDQGFPDGYQVLCYNCNISKHRNGNVCGHQIRRRLND